MKRWQFLLPLVAAAAAAWTMLAPDEAHAACAPGTKPILNAQGKILCVGPHDPQPSVQDQCHQLLVSIKPKAEAERVYHNCVVGLRQLPGDFFICPDGSHAALNNARACSSR